MIQIQNTKKVLGTVAIQKTKSFLAFSLEIHQGHQMETIDFYLTPTGRVQVNNILYNGITEALSVYDKLVTSSFPRFVHEQAREALCEYVNYRLHRDVPFAHIQIWADTLAKYWEKALNAEFKFSRFYVIKRRG